MRNTWNLAHVLLITALANGQHGLPDSRFNSLHTISSGNKDSLIDVVSVDLDLDGKTDLVASMYVGANAYVGVYMNEGNGKWSATLIHSMDGLSENIVARDINNDMRGLPDIVCMGNMYLTWFENQGDRHFLEHSDVPTFVPRNFVADDVDRDGFVDLLVSSYADREGVRFMKGNGTGFTEVQLTSGTDDTLSNRAISLAVANTDTIGGGGSQLYVTYREYSTRDTVMHYEFDNSSSRFSDGERLFEKTDENIGDVLVVDHLEDTPSHDILFPRENLAYYRQENSGAPAPVPVWEELIIDNGTGFINTAVVFDVDHDTDLDIVVCSIYRVWWYENLGASGGFGNARLIDDGSGNGCRVVNTMTKGDIDNDGFEDLIVNWNKCGTSDIPMLVWYRNGTFGADL